MSIKGDQSVYNKICSNDYMPKEPVKDPLGRRKTGRLRNSNMDDGNEDRIE